MELFILIGLILLNGVFAMSEIAIVTAKQSRLSALAAKGGASASAALRLSEDPTSFLSTVQIGITSIGIMSGIYGESVLAEPFGNWLQSLGISASTSTPTATALVVIIITYCSIVVGELVPKRLGQLRPESIACIVARPMHWLAILAKPFVALLSHSTHLLISLLRLKNEDGKAVTEEDIHALLLEGSSAGVIEREEHAMVKNVLRLDERPITSIMVPRSDIIYLDTSLPLAANYQRLMQAPHSTFPVCHQQIDNVVGLAHAKDLLALAITGESVDIAASAKPCRFVLESLTAMELLELFRTSSTDMVFVVDEYGDVQGIVTPHDLLEALAGEFFSREDDAWVVRRADGSLLIDGLLPALDLKDWLDLKELPDEGSYQTLNGLILKIMDRVPLTGEKLQLQHWEMEIVDMDGHRVDKVLATRKAEPEFEPIEDDG